MREKESQEAKKQMNDQKIVGLVEQHYRDFQKPLLLSELGKRLREERLWPVEGQSKKLSEFISAFAPRLEVHQDPNVPAYTYVVMPEYKEGIEKVVELRKDLSFLKKFPRSMLIAFVVQVPEGSKVYLQTTPPFRYRVSKASPSNDFLEVGAEYRVPGLDVDILETVAPRHLETLSSKIDDWLKMAGFSASDFDIFDKPSSADQHLDVPSFRRVSMLERLRAAQPTEIADRMVIPLDIALLLSKHFQ